MNKFFVFFSWIVVSIFFATTVLVFYWEVIPYKVIEFREGNGTILSKKVKVGDSIGIRQNQCKFINIPASVNRQFVDTLVYQVNTVITNRPVGCHDQVEIVDIPKLLPSGLYKIRTIISYKINPVRTINYLVETDAFEVINDSFK
jgi:hypothetical protein